MLLLAAGDGEPVPLLAAFLFGPVLVVAGGLILAIAVQGWRGALPRNRGMGIRTPQTLASDEAWAVAHRAAGPWMAAGSLGSIVPGVVLLLRPPNGTGILVVLAGLGLMVALVMLGGIVANQAIRTD